VARLGAALVAERVLVSDRTLADIGDDLHVRVGMRRKAGVRCDLVVVPDAQGAVADIGGSGIVREGEVMFGLQPAVVGAPELGKGFQFNHVMSFSIDLVGSRVSRPALVSFESQAPKPPSTLSTVPVTNEASGLARKTTPAATSSGLPKRCSAWRERCASAKSPPSFGFMSVLIDPGCTTLTVMPRGPRSRAAPLVYPTTAALVAV